jgi:LmbE family N-acetylglucosaminyl deacetylase
MNSNSTLSCGNQGLSRRAFAALAAKGALGFAALRAVAADQPGRYVPPDDGKLRIIAFGAHPDDCELPTGGCTAMWSAKGHHVKLVAVTNGDIGSWHQAGGPLARRRKAEAEKTDEMLGAHSEILDNHDGELMPTLENRLKLIRLIREWRADLVLSPRPNDYHPDHRYTGVLVQDASFMVTVPFICPDVPFLRSNPVFMYYVDRFKKPNPSKADVAVDIDSVIDKKLDALAIMESQFLEGGAIGNETLMPKTPEQRVKRIAQVRAGHESRYLEWADRFRKDLVKWYGEERGSKVRHAEAFEICEYGRQPNEEELKRLFPFFG